MAKKFLNENIQEGIVPDSWKESSTGHTGTSKTDFTLNKEEDLFGLDIESFKEQTGTEGFALSPSEVSKGQKGFGKTLKENEVRAEDIEAYTQGTLDKVANGTVKFLGRVGTSFAGSTIGTLYGLAAWAKSGEFRSFYDNDFQDGLDGVNDYLAEEFKHHYTSDPNDWEVSNFIFDKVFDGLGFATGAVLSGMTGAGVVGKIGKGIKFTKALKAGAVKELKDLSAKGASKGAIRQATLKVDKLDKIGRNLSQIPQTLVGMTTGAVYESGVEARHAYDEIKTELIEGLIVSKSEGGIKYVPSDKELQEINQLAGESANGIFAANMALVGSSNFLQFGRHLGLSFGQTKRLLGQKSIAKEAAKRGVDKFAKKGSTKLRGLAAATKRPIVESQEEMLQSVISGTGEEYAKRKYTDDKTDLTDLLDASLKSFKKTYTSKQGWEEGLIGAIVGGMGVVAPKRTAEGKRTVGLIGGVYEGIKDFQADESNRNAIVDLLNKKDIISSLKTSAVHLTRDKELENAKDVAQEIDNQLDYENAKNEQLHSYIDARYQAGMIKSVYEDLQELRDKPLDDFKDAFGIPKEAEYTEEDRTKEINSLIRQTERIEDNFKFIENLYPNVSEDNQRALAFNKSTFERTEERKQNIVDEITKLTNGTFNLEAKEDVFEGISKDDKLYKSEVYEKLYKDYQTLSQQQDVLAVEWSKAKTKKGQEKLDDDVEDLTKKAEKEANKTQVAKDKAKKRTKREENADVVAKEKKEQTDQEALNKALEGKVVPETKDNKSTLPFTPEDTKQFINNINNVATPEELAKFIDDSGKELENLPEEAQIAYNKKIKEVEAQNDKIAQQKSDPKGTDSVTEQTNSVRTTSEDSINEPTDVNVPPVKVTSANKQELEDRISESNRGKDLETNGVQEETKGVYYVGRKLVDGFESVSARTRDFDEVGGVIKETTDTNNDSAVPDIFFPENIKEGDQVTIRLYEDDTLGEKNNDKTSSDQIMEVFITNNQGIEVSAGYVHDLDYITESRIVPSTKDFPNNIERNKDSLQAFRDDLYNKLTKSKDVDSVKVKIKSLTPGSILTKPNKKYDNKISDIIQDDIAPEIVVVKEGGLYLGNTPLEESRLAGKIINNFEAEDLIAKSGITMIAVPSANGQYILSLVRNGVVSESATDISTAISDVIVAYVNEDIETLDSYGVQNSDLAVRDYINNFIYTTGNTVKDGITDKHYMFVGVNEEGVRSVSFESGGSIKRYNSTSGKGNLSSLTDKVSNSLISVDLNKITDKDAEIQIKDGEVLSYRDFMLDNLYVNFSSEEMTTSTGKAFRTYVANPIIHLDIEGTVEMKQEPSVKETILNSEDEKALKFYSSLNTSQRELPAFYLDSRFKKGKELFEQTEKYLYRGLPVINSNDIVTAENTAGAAKYDRKNNKILVDREFLREKYLDKAWTKPRELTEMFHGEVVKSYAEALPLNSFNTYEQFEKFVIEHEYQHSLLSREQFNKESVFRETTKGDYETEINKRALNALIIDTTNSKIKDTKNGLLSKYGKRGGKKSPAKFERKQLLKGLPRVIDPKTNSLLASKQNYDITKSIGYIVYNIVQEDSKIGVSDAFNNVKEEFEIYRDNYLEYAKQESISSNDTDNGAAPTPEANAELAESFTLVLDNFDVFKDNTKIYLSSRGLKIKDNRITEIEETIKGEQDIVDESEADELNGATPDRTKQSYDAASFEENPINKLSSEVKVLLDSIPDENANILGLDTTHDLETVYNTLLGIIANRISDTSEDTLELLKYNTENKPYISYIVDMLESDEMSQKDKNMFYSHFKKIYKEFEIVLHKDNTYRLVKGNRNTISKLIEKDWSTNIDKVDVFTEENGATVVDKTFVDTKLQALWNKIEKDDYSVASTKTFLNSLGIDISTEALKYLKDNNSSVSGFDVSWEQLFKAKNNGAFKVIKEKFEGTTKPDVHPLATEGFFKKLAKLESRFREDVSTSSHLGAGGKSIFAFSNSIWFANRFEQLKDISYVNRLLEVPFIKHSRYLNKLKAKDKNFTDSFGISTLDTLTHKGRKDVKFAGLSNREKLVAQISLFVNSQQGEKNKISKFIVAKSDKGPLDILTAERHKVTNLSKGKIHRDDMRVLLNIVKGEYARIKDAQNKYQEHFDKTGKDLFEDIDGYNPFRFYFFEKLNNILDTSKDGELRDWDDMLNSNTSDEVQNVIKEALLTEESKTKDVLNEAGIIKDGKLDIVDEEYIKDNTNNPDFFIRDFVINNMIANAEYSMIFQGDVAVASKGTVEASFDNMFKRLAKDIAPANRGAKHAGENSFNQYRQIFLQDSKNSSLSMESYKELIPNDLAAYEEIEGTDAQEVTLLSEHLDVMYHDGRIEDEVYERLMKESKKPNPFYSNEDLKVLLNPHKPVHVGNYILPEYGVDLPVYVKTSSYPLIPQLIQGTEFEKLEKLMRTHKDSDGKKPIARAVFHSGVKLGGYKIIDAWGKELDAEGNETDVTNGKFNEEAIKDALKDGAYLTLNRDNFGIQQDMPYDAEKNAILEGSQLMKLIQAGIKNPEVLKEFDSLHMGIVDKAYDKFLNRIKATENEDGTFTFNKVAKLKDLLIEELKERGDYSPNDINALDLNADGTDFLTPLWSNPKAAQFESLLNSFVSKKVLRQKLPGKSYNLASEEGYKGRAADIEYVTEGLVGPKYNPNKGLRSQRIGYIKGNSKIEVESYNELSKEDKADYTKTTFPAQILIANPLNLKQKQLVLYRIPTQDLNSMSSGEAVGYLPDYVGDLAIVSKDYLAQMGSDNDGDKIYVHRWHENKGGYKVNDESANYEWERYQETRAKQQVEFDKVKALDAEVLAWFNANFNKEYEVTEEDLQEYSDKIIKNTLTEDEFKEFFSKKVDQNKIMDIYYDTLMDIDNLPRIVKPLGFGNLKDVASDITSEPHHPLSPIRQIDNYENGNAGKFGVSVTSLLSTGNALLNAAYRTTGKDIKVLVPTVRGYEFPNFKFKLSNKEYTNINSINDSELTLDGSMTKADVISAFQSVSVDNIKELVITKINYNRHTHDSVIALSYLGLTDTYIADVIKQPAIVNYVKTRENLNDPYSQIEGNVEQAAFELTVKQYEGQAKQLANLKKFEEYSKAGKEIAKLIKAIQPATKGVGKNMVVSDIKLSRVNDVLITEGLTNVNTVVGSVHQIKDDFNNRVVTPTTISGQGVDILRRTNNLYSGLFEVNTAATKLAEAISLNRGTEVSALTEKERTGIVKFVKSYIYSANLKMYAGKDVNEYRQELLFGDNTLAVRWNQFKKDNPDHWLAERLNVTTPKGANQPHTVSYQASSADKTNDVHNTSTLIDMLLDDNDTTRQLAIDTIAYTYLRGGNQDAHSLLKFLPNTYLQSVDMGGDAKSFVNKIINDEIDNEIMLEQYFQHNPYHADMSERPVGIYTAVNTEDGWELYRGPEQLDLLGTTESIETQFDVKDAKSFNKDNQIERVDVKDDRPDTFKPNTVLAPGVQNTNKNINSTAIKYNITSESASTVIDKIANTGLEKYKVLAKALAPLTFDVSIKLADLSKAGANGLFNKQGILIDKELKEDSEFQRVVLHEGVHAAISKVIDNPNEQQKVHVDSLKAVFNVARKEYKGSNKNALKNIHEFITELMTDSSFQKELHSIEFNKQKSLFDRIVELFDNIFSASTGEEITNITMQEVLILMSTVESEQLGTKENIDIINSIPNDIELDDTQDEFQSPIIVPENITDIVTENSNISDVGSAIQYSNYLKTIFPDSEMNDIVYHNTPNKFDKFDKKKIGSTSIKQVGMNSNDSELGFFFTSSKEAYEGFVISGNKMPILLNIKNPTQGGVNYNNLVYPYPDRLDSEKNLVDDSREYWRALLGYLQREGYDSVHYGKSFLDMEEGGGMIPISEYIVFEPEQIHILGSKQDIENFKEFVKKDKQSLQYYSTPTSLKNDIFGEMSTSDLNDRRKNCK